MRKMTAMTNLKCCWCLGSSDLGQNTELNLLSTLEPDYQITDKFQNSLVFVFKGEIKR